MPKVTKAKKSVLVPRFLQNTVHNDQPHLAMIRSGREAMLPYTKEPVQVVRAVVASDAEYDATNLQFICVSHDRTITVPANELHPVTNEPITA